MMFRNLLHTRATLCWTSYRANFRKMISRTSSGRSMILAPGSCEFIFTRFCTGSIFNCQDFEFKPKKFRSDSFLSMDVECRTISRKNPGIKEKFLSFSQSQVDFVNFAVTEKYFHDTEKINNHKRLKKWFEF